MEGLVACEEKIDLSACDLSPSDLGRLYADLLYSHPELFHVALRLSYTTREVTVNGNPCRQVSEIYPIYTLTGEELTAARTLYRDTVAATLAGMDTAFREAPPSEAEIVLYIHDRLAEVYAYDTTEGGNADAYTFFRDGRGICQAYALAFIALARGAGLEADFVSSESMDHAWNHVRVDGVWYHVDVTRDDPIPASPGSEQVNHTRLLRSDEGMNSLGYHGYTCSSGHTCTDTGYEPDGRGVLMDFSSPLEVMAPGCWMGTNPEGAPVAVGVDPGGIRPGLPGDTDRDGSLTPADLLTVYDPTYPESWRKWLRERLTS